MSVALVIAPDSDMTERISYAEAKYGDRVRLPGYICPYRREVMDWHWRHYTVDHVRPINDEALMLHVVLDDVDRAAGLFPHVLVCGERVRAGLLRLIEQDGEDQ